MILFQKSRIAEFGIPVIMYDSRNWDGSSNIPNEGDGGTVWDLPFDGQNQTQFWGRKRNNWYAQADTVGPFPSSFADLNGDWCADGFVHVTALPHAIRRWDGAWAECEWYINALDEFGISLGFTGFGNYFDGPLVDPGSGFAGYGKVFSDTSLGDDGSYHEWYPVEEFLEGDSSGAIGAVIAGAMIVTYIDPANGDSASWLVNSKEVRLIATGPDDDTHTQFLVACTYDSGGTDMDRMFWSFGYHVHYPPYAGTPWNGVIGQALFRESNRPSEARMRIWYDYFFDAPAVDLLGQETDEMVDSTVKAHAIGYAIDYRSTIVVDDNLLIKFDASIPHRPAWRNSAFNADLVNAVDCVMDDSGVYAFVATSTNTVHRWRTSANPPDLHTSVTDATDLLSPTAMCGDVAVHYCKSRLFVVASGKITAVNRSSVTVEDSIDVSATGRPCSYPNPLLLTSPLPTEDAFVVTPDTSDNIVVLSYDIAPTPTLAVEATFDHAALTGPIAVEVATYSRIDVHAFVLNSDGTVVSIDLADPTSPSVVDTVATSVTTPRRLFLRGLQLLVIGDGEVGFVDVADPADLTEVGTPTSIGIGVDPTITLGLDHLWVGISDTSLSSYSLTGEGAAANVWTMVDELDAGADTDSVGGFVKVGDYLYVANRFGNIDAGTDGGLVTVDVSTPASISIADTLSDPDLDHAVDVAYDGTYLYVLTTDAQEKLTVVDISTPTAPFVVASVATGAGLASRVTIDGSYAYVTDFSDDAVIVIDISTPASLFVDNTLTDATNLNGPGPTVVIGDYLYVTTMGHVPLREGRMTIIDITDPTAPTVEGSTQPASLTVANPVGLAVSPDGNWAFAACDLNELFVIFDTSTKTAPIQDTFVDLDQTATTGRQMVGAGGSVWLDNDRIIVLGGINGQGVAVINVGDPESPFIEEYWDGLIAGAPASLNSNDAVVDGGYIYGTSYFQGIVWVAQYA